MHNSPYAPCNSSARRSNVRLLRTKSPSPSGIKRQAADLLLRRVWQSAEFRDALTKPIRKQ